MISLDAAAMLLIAAQARARGEARSFPDPPDHDEYGLPSRSGHGA